MNRKIPEQAGTQACCAISQYGVTACRPEWAVTEPVAAGFCRIYHITGGGLTYQDKQGQQQMTPGFLYVFPENKPYQMSHNPEQPLACLYFHASLLPLVFNQPIKILVIAGSFLEQLLQTMSALISSAGDPAILQQLFNALVIWLRTEMPLTLLEPRIHKTLTYMQAHINRSISIDELSGLAGWQRHYYIRRFKQAVGVTPYRYLIRQRLHQSTLLLLDGQTVSMAAQLSGYPDVKSYSKAFVQHYGIAPSRYRHYFRPTP